MSTPLLQVSGIDKSFFGVSVLQDISFQLSAGVTLGLVGENGAGKSTLMNIIGGILQPDRGSMRVRGEAFAPNSPRDAERSGIAFIHQELNLFPNLSIAENIFLTHFPQRLRSIDKKKMHGKTAELLRRVGVPLPPTEQVENLSAGERQLVEIAKALNQNAQLIILDEPTTSLTARETERLFELIKTLRSKGIAMIYISHALDHIQQLCDQIVILRDGQIVGTNQVAEFNSAQVVSLMVGRDIEHQYPPSTRKPDGKTVLSVRNVSCTGTVEDISFDVRKSEIVGIAGLMGSGRTELARILFGLDKMTSGEIELNGQAITNLPTRERIKSGMAFLTESRRDDGLCVQASILDNMGLVAAHKFANRALGLLRMRWYRSNIDRIRTSVKLTPTAKNQQTVQTLSGGNQQKVVLAKWLLNEPCFLILDEPTRGIDVGAKYEIYRLIDELAARGASILMISSEMEELIGVCDRIFVMNRGEIKDELTRQEFSQERIMHSALWSKPGGAT